MHHCLTSRPSVSSTLSIVGEFCLNGLQYSGEHLQKRYSDLQMPIERSDSSAHSSNSPDVVADASEHMSL